MEATHVFDEERVRWLLTGTTADIARGLEMIDHHLRNRLCGWLRKRFPSMDPDDLANTWADTLVCVLEAARRRRFDGSRSLFPWLCQIANARAIDHTRRLVTREEVLVAVGLVLRQAQAGSQWKLLNGVEGNEVRQLIRDAIAMLPEQQKKVFQVFVDHFPESRSMDNLQREVSRVTGRAETLASVKRALQEGRQKVRAFLRRKGYALDIHRGEP